MTLLLKQCSWFSFFKIKPISSYAMICPSMSKATKSLSMLWKVLPMILVICHSMNSNNTSACYSSTQHLQTNHTSTTSKTYKPFCKWTSVTCLSLLLKWTTLINRPTLSAILAKNSAPKIAYSSLGSAYTTVKIWLPSLIKICMNLSKTITIPMKNPKISLNHNKSSNKPLFNNNSPKPATLSPTDPKSPIDKLLIKILNTSFPTTITTALSRHSLSHRHHFQVRLSRFWVTLKAWEKVGKDKSRSNRNKLMSLSKTSKTSWTISTIE